MLISKLHQCHTVIRKKGKNKRKGWINHILKFSSSNNGSFYYSVIGPGDLSEFYLSSDISKLAV